MKIINNNRIASIALASVLAIMLVIPTIGNAAEAAVDLGTASSFAVLAGSTITNTGDTTISGSAGSNVGLHPKTAFTGETSATISGDVYLAEATASEAKDDLLTAYNNATGRTPTTTIETELGGQTLIPGVYDSASGTFGLTGTLTLDGKGDPNAVFIFLMDSTLVTAGSSIVSNINSATSCQVYWVVGSSATLGANSEFVGTIMASESITATTGATVKGRLLALGGAVTLNTNTITNDVCSIADETSNNGDTTTPPAIIISDDDRDDRDDQEAVDEPEAVVETEAIVVEPEATEEPEAPNEPRLPATGAAATTALSGLGASFMLAGFALLKNKK
ncbi:ice-binding family protein [Gudongella sp. DL1XJH-153]|uniref:ice-binding family protein n=1 Tax=Gudongella sp. DL1XJH-153 TaxID=3409804 RepID=UPI003BB4900D